MALRAVTLDAAGTLIEVAESVAVTYARVAAGHGIGLDAGPLGRAFEEAFAAAPPLAFPGASPTQLASHERAWWYAVVRRAFGAGARHPAFDACFAELYALYGQAGAWRVSEGAREALVALRARGLRLAVVSNFDARLVDLLAALGLGGVLDTIVCSSRAGSAKPDPGIFREALGRLGVIASEALHAGDSPRLDVEGARAAGLEAVLVDRGGHASTSPRVRIIRTIAELPALVTLF